MTACSIDWTDDIDAWDARFAALRRSTLLQSRAYAEAVCPALGQRARQGLVRIGGAVAGLVQVQEASLMRRALHAVILDRGPVWAEGFGTADHARAFFAGFARVFPARPGRRRRVIPELPASAGDALDACGFARLPAPGYQTYWIDLSPEPDALRRGLDGKWRNRLVKAEASGLEVAWDWSGLALGPFLKGHAADMADHGRPGAETATLVALSRSFRQQRGLGVGVALLKGEPVAGVMMLRHGAAATWQAGWVGAEGRLRGANNLLLWHAMLELRAAGVLDLDLGGVNDADATGVKRFKGGLGGRLTELAGQFR